MWQKYELRTQQSAIDLCEQLRIILEPNKQGGFEGDYKTGKRLHMKRVIAYIASQFRKDKIWLRRTKLSKRAYQVLLAVDDSFSMIQHDLVEVALEGLTMLVQALNKLEIGEVSIAAIRDGMTLLHEFGRPFSADQAAFVMSQLAFEYGLETHSSHSYAVFMKQCSEYLRRNAGRQLVILISDGRINKAAVRPWVRLSKDIFCLMIILDNPQQSILKTPSVSYDPTTKKTTMQPYLDDFPFDYYVVLQDPRLLLDTLSEILRQWFAITLND
jgi:midasin